jgi:hypothetical protein
MMASYSRNFHESKANGTGTDARKYPQKVVPLDELVDDYIAFMQT